MAELKSYLSSMDPQDRIAALSRYDERFDRAGKANEKKVIANLGSPAKVAISIKREFNNILVPFPNSGVPSSENTAVNRERAEELGDKSQDKQYLADTGSAQSPEDEPVNEVPSPALSTAPGKRINVFKLIVYIIPSIIIGIPAMILVFAISLIFFALGAALLAGGIHFFMTGFSMAGLLSDSLLIFGSSIILFAVGLPIVCLAIWLCGTLIHSIVSLILRIGRRFCYKGVDAS